MSSQNSFRFVEVLFGFIGRDANARKAAWKKSLKTSLRIEGLERREMMSIGSPLDIAAALAPVSVAPASAELRATGMSPVAATAKPNLVPCRPSNWSGGVVVSTSSGTNTDSTTITTNDSLYVDWAELNSSSTAITKAFKSSLYVDGQLKATWSVNPPLNGNYYIYAQDYCVGKLAAGQHTIQVKADSANNIAESNESDNLASKTITVASGSSSGSYMITTQYGGKYWDADKSSTDSKDDYLCWAATASNMLQWTGWGQVSNMTTSDAVFKYFENHFSNAGSKALYGCQWWFNGSYPAQGQSGWSQVTTAGGKFFPSYSFSSYAVYDQNPANAPSDIASYLRSGRVVGLGVYTNGGGHAITCWGYKYDANNKFQGVYVTDSDDNMTNPTGDYLKYYDVKLSNSKYYLQNFYGYNTWYIGDVTGLARRPSTGAVATTGMNEKPMVVGGLPVGAAAAVAAATDEALQTSLLPTETELAPRALPEAPAQVAAIAPQAQVSLNEQPVRDAFAAIESERAGKLANDVEQELATAMHFSVRAADAVFSTSI